MSTVTLEEAQAHLSELIERLHPGEEILITDQGQPLAQVKRAERSSWPCKAGSYRKDEFWMAPDFDAPLDDFKEIGSMSRGESSPAMKVIDLQEAKANLEQYARECQTSPVVVMKDGKPCFELLPIRSDDPGFLDRLLEHDSAFRDLVDERRNEGRSGRVSSLESVRERLDGFRD